MPIKTHTMLIGALVLAATLPQAIAAGLGSARQSLAAPAADDLVTQRLPAASTHADSSGLDRVPVSTSWALDASAALDARPQPYRAQSREFWLDAREAELQAGVPLHLSAAGAVIRVSPRGGARTAIATSDLQLRRDGRVLDPATSVRAAADEDALRAAGLDAPEGSVALRLTDAVGAGTLTLSAPTARGDYLVHVFEPASPVVLSLVADRDTVAGGNALEVHADIAGARDLARLGGLAVAPDGSTQSIDFARGADGRWSARFVPDARHGRGPALWEVHAFGVTAGAAAIARDAKTAFAVSTPVARLDGTVTRLPAQGIAFELGIESTTASRYGVSAVLYGTGEDGGLHPAAIAQSAAWLEGGRHALALTFAPDSVPAGMHGPWQLRDLRLVDQADMGLQERRAQALAFD